MEASSIPESEQQQQQLQHLAQLNPQLPPLQFQEQSSQQQQQQALSQYPQQQYQDYYYHQTYDQSSYYYSYYQQYPHQNQWPQFDQQPQNYAYYQQQPDYYQQQPISYQQHETAPLPGVSAPQISDSGGTDHQRQSAYPLPPQGGLVNAAVVPPSSRMNPAAAAAIAALEQLTHLAGTMDAAERAMSGLPAVNTLGLAHVSMRSLLMHRGGGRRGGGPSRGGRKGNTGHHHGSSPSFRGRGHGRGKARSRRFQLPGATSTSSHAEPSGAYEHSTDEATPSVPAPQNAVPKHRPAQIAWCELCRVDCTSLEILEQHKNGKRHKKNLLRIEELENAVKTGKEIQNDKEHNSDTKPEESQQEPHIAVAQDGEEKKSAEHIPSEAPSDEPGVENVQSNTREKPEAPVEDSSEQQGRKPKTKLSDNKRHGIKRKMKGGRGGKRMKTCETHRQPVEPPKPKVVIPLICDLCNVKCDTQEVLDKHRSGKKHIAKLKRFQGHQAIYGPTGLQALYPPNPSAQTHFAPQGQQPVYTSQGSFPPQMPSQARLPTAAAVASLDPHFPLSSLPQQSATTATAVLRL